MSKVILIIIANILPLIGVIFWGWDLGNVILLYWTENLVLGFCTIAKMLTAQGKGDGNSLGAKIFICCFFTVHYSIFCFGHLSFILYILKFDPGEALFTLTPLINSGLITKGVLTGTAIMFITHGIDFFQNYLRSEQRQKEANVIMFSPYGHIVVIHIAIIFSAAFVMLTGEALGLLILIILGKIALELYTLKRSQRKAIEAAAQRS